MEKQLQMITQAHLGREVRGRLGLLLTYNDDHPSRRFLAPHRLQGIPPSILISSRTSPSVDVPTDGALYSPKILSPSFDTPFLHGRIANSEIDITQFPAWSRGWYAEDSCRSQKTGPRFDASHAPPSYRATRIIWNQYDPYAAATSSSSRDFVP
ncbi:hypothetical protein BJV78DRAFT_695264 [Lactifluus subvellereus]|nr:hypothetical protein BJV78DRAFT_695264 [Lactifluus subvellereus]